MAKPLKHHDEWSDVESLIRAAGNYVRPSEELRPRVLESARAEARERLAQRRIWQVALAIALSGALLAAVASRGSSPASFPAGILTAQAALRPADAREGALHSAEGGAAGWSIVEAYVELRRRQAALLGLDR